MDVQGYSIRVVPWPSYSDLTLEPWFAVNVRGPAGSFWPYFNGRRFAGSNELVRMEQKAPGLAALVAAALAPTLGGEA